MCHIILIPISLTLGDILSIIIAESIVKKVIVKPSFSIDSHSINSFLDSLSFDFSRIEATAIGSVAEIMTQNRRAESKGISKNICTIQPIIPVLMMSPKLATIEAGKSTFLKW